MQYQINCRDIEKSQTMENMIENNLERLAKYHKIMRGNTNFKIEVRYFDDTKQYRVTINADIGDKRHIHSIESHKDLSIAIKNSILPLAKQLEKFKKMITKNQRSETHQNHQEEIDDGYLIDELEEENNSNV